MLLQFTPLALARPNIQSSRYRAGDGDDQIAEETLIMNVEQAGQRAADERAGDADQDVGEQAVLAVHRLLGDLAGEKADHQHAEEADARHAHDSDALIHRLSPPRGHLQAVI